MKNYIYYSLFAYCGLNRLVFEYGPVVLAFFLFDLWLALTILGVFIVWNILGLLLVKESQRRQTEQEKIYE